MPPNKRPVLPADLSGAVPVSAQIPVGVFPCFRARASGAPPLIDLSRVVLEASRESFVGLDRHAAGDLLRPILAQFGARGGADLTAQMRLAGTLEREAVGSRSFQRAVGTHVVLEHALHRLRAHLKVVDENFVILPAPSVLLPATTINTTTTTATTPLLLAATAAAAATTTTAATAGAAVVAAQDPALLLIQVRKAALLSFSSSRSHAGRTTSTPSETTSETTSEGATTAAPPHHDQPTPTAAKAKEEAKDEDPSGGKESLQLDHHHSSTREIDHIKADGYGFDYVMVFKAEEAGVVTEYANKAVRRIIAAGLTVRVYFSLSGRDIFCEIRASVERLRQFADQVGRRLLLDEFELAKTAVAGDAEANIGPIMINDDPRITFRSPYEFIYARYDRTQHLQNLYFKSDDLSHPFRSVVRLSLVMDILKTPMYLGGAGLKVDQLQFEGKIEALFPKHFEQNKSRLQKKWLVLRQWPWDAPYNEIKEYYGEKIGLYFHFLGHLTTWLLPLAVAGLVTAMTVYITGNLEHPTTLVFAPIVVVWAIIMLEFWKRKEQRIALEWGMAGFETGEQDRPEYKGEFIPSPIDGSTILYYPASRKKSRARRATLVIVSMILIVVSCIGAVYAFRWYLVYGSSDTGTWGETYGGVISSVVNAIQIQLLNAIYKKIAVALTDFENHRTSTEYEDSLVKKLFSFTFCNSYGGFIYLAFIGEPAIDIECEDSCMTLLSTNLTIVFVVQILVGNLTEVFIPYVKFRLRARAERRGGTQEVDEKAEVTQEAPESETALYLEPYDPIMGTLMDYAELAVQFGYITLFVVAFPLAPFLALANNYVEFRSDAFKLLTQMRRPVPRGAEDIGSWQGVFTLIASIAVVTNSALVCLIYEDTVEKFSLSTRLWIFILLQWVAFSFMAAVSEWVPDVPEDVTLQLQRTEFLSSKIIDQVPDVSEDSKLEVDESALQDISFVISPPVSPPGGGNGKKDLPPEDYVDQMKF